MTQRLPSCIALMPENPCRGWPLNGVETPVGRGADLSEMYDVPGIVPTASMRRQSGLVYLPETANVAGASLGGGSGRQIRVPHELGRELLLGRGAEWNR